MCAAHVFPLVGVAAIATCGGGRQGEGSIGTNIGLIAALNRSGRHYRTENGNWLRFRSSCTTGSGRYFIKHFGISRMVGRKVGSLIGRSRESTKRISHAKIIDHPLTGRTAWRARYIINRITLTNLGGRDGDSWLWRGTNGNSLGGRERPTSVRHSYRNTNRSGCDVVNVRCCGSSIADRGPAVAGAPLIGWIGESSSNRVNIQHALRVGTIDRRSETYGD